ncbi:Crp/Fnr family transcriptional regulator [Rhizobiaceae bacterium]|nr:Crp/Fnr family transcriptional regulator [Rhizobiaceae bacterium]
MMANARNLLHTVSLFEGLGAEVTNAIGDIARWQSVAPNQFVLEVSDGSDDVYFVTEGRLAATIFSVGGREVNYLQLGRGDVFGEFAALDGNARSASIVSLTDSVVAALTSAQFRDVILQHPSVGLQLARLLVVKNRMLTQRIFEFSTLSVPVRVACELLRISQAAGDGSARPVVTNMPTHYQIASRISTSREAVSRAVSDLVARGIIETAAHTMTVLDTKALRRAAGGEDLEQS